ncbi:MAG: ribosomal RNA small subunit methyltransferase A [Chloroflexi bacterium]|nr:ribosomal RNA small subunit methyltransferase A [Chloroflexota bacterium]
MIPRKSLGQHFLTNRSITARIVDVAQLKAGDCVVEVGPGLGILTEELAGKLSALSGGKIIAIELDDKLLPLLRERFAAMPQVSFIHADVLKTTPGALTGGGPYKVVANLPYYITSAVLRHFLEADVKPASLTVMVQREVAERMAAKPPDMSLLAVGVQLYGKPKVLFRVPPGAFNPPPKVESAVVQIEVYSLAERPVVPLSDKDFFKVAQAGFSQKRKQVANTLSSGLHLGKADVIVGLKAAGIEPTRRAETLTIAEWAAVEKTLIPASQLR